MLIDFCLAQLSLDRLHPATDADPQPNNREEEKKQEEEADGERRRRRKRRRRTNKRHLYLKIVL